MSALKLEDWVILDAIRRGQVYRAESRADWYEPRFGRGVDKHRVDRTTRRLREAGLARVARFGPYELTDAGRAELERKAVQS